MIEEEHTAEKRKEYLLQDNASLYIFHMDFEYCQISIDNASIDQYQFVCEPQHYKIWCVESDEIQISTGVNWCVLHLMSHLEICLWRCFG